MGSESGGDITAFQRSNSVLALLPKHHGQCTALGTLFTVLVVIFMALKFAIKNQ